MTAKGGTSQACAACKYQRRRCTTDCALAPYFPANKPEMFRNAHRLFGVRNIVRILEQLREDQKDEAMKSIIFESDMRDRFPIHGCSWVIWQLKDQLRKSEEELFYVNSLLIKLRNKEEIDNYNCNFNPLSVSDLAQYSPPTTSQFQLGLVPRNDLSNFHFQPTNNNEVELMLNNNNNNLGFFESNDGVGKSGFWVQQEGSNYYGNNIISCDNQNNMNVNVNSFGSMKSSNDVIPEALPLQHEIDEGSNEYGDMPYEAIGILDRQSYIESLEACESSVGSPLKDTMQSMTVMSQNHDLKSAAACLTLTSVN